jgi:hypothetical protein
MEEFMSTKSIGIVLLILGILIILVGLFAGYIGLSASHTIGMKKILLAGGGLVVGIVGIVLMVRKTA